MSTLTDQMHGLTNSDLRMVERYGKEGPAWEAAAELSLRDVRRDQQRAAELGIAADKVYDSLQRLLDTWTSDDMPGDFAADTGFPFDTDLEEQIARVAEWADKLRAKASAPIWRCRACGNVWAETVHDPVGYGEGAICKANVPGTAHPCDSQGEWVLGTGTPA